MQPNLARSLPTVIGVAVAGLLGGLSAPLRAAPSNSAAATGAARVDETERTETALHTIAKHWGEAELTGDVAYLEQLMAPEYKSIDPKGVSHPRAMIIARAKREGGSAEARKRVDAFKQAHPTEMSIVVHGTLGIVSYFNPSRGVDNSIRGSDVFVYEAQRWHAVYSMHNSAE